MKSVVWVPLGFFVVLCGPVTYAINVASTWQSGISFWGKLLLSLTLDPALAAIWPVTWLAWLVMYWTGLETPLTSVLGF